VTLQTKIIPDAPGKIAMAFGFEDETHFIVAESRSRLAHMMKCYRASKRYSIERAGLHHYRVSMTGYSPVASILPYRGRK